MTAPLLFLLLGGASFGFLYKAVNTMDSMLGYKNEKYLYFGRFPAKMDDVFNYIPSRVTALFMIAAAFLTEMDAKNAWMIWRRDRRKHASPNSAQTESVCAGALRVRLAGDAVYFGKLHKKEYLGDPLRPIEPEDIRRAGRTDVCDGISRAAGIRSDKAGGDSVTQNELFTVCNSRRLEDGSFF